MLIVFGEMQWDHSAQSRYVPADVYYYYKLVTVSQTGTSKIAWVKPSECQTMCFIYILGICRCFTSHVQQKRGKHVE